MNDASQARVMQSINGEYPDNKLAVNYSIIQQGDSPRVPPQDPWSFLDVRFDWTEDSVNFWIGANRTRAATKDDRTLPSVPQPLYFSHWSTGDDNYMQGPPINRSVANILWVRAFFNSSLMTTDDHVAYDRRCNATAACSIDDMSLRGYSNYSSPATMPWTPPSTYQHIRDIAGIVAAAFSFFGVGSLFNAFLRRTPWHKVRKIHFPGNKTNKTNALRQSLRQSVVYEGHETPGSGSQTPAPGYSGTMTPVPGYTTRAQSVVSLNSPADSRRPSVAQLRIKGSSIQPLTEKVVEVEDETETARTEAYNALHARNDVGDIKVMYEEDNGISDKASFKVVADAEGVEGTFPSVPEVPHAQSALQIMKETSVPDAMTGGALANTSVQEAQVKEQKQVRIDYLAGLVAISCIMVTLRHFSLTFWPYVTEGQGDIMHFEADGVMSLILGPYFLTPLWIGPFFVTSCRFLAQRYLRTGKLNDIANKMLLRAPRMLIPCFIFITLEYFLISLGLTSRLEWLPSVSYSTWPYVQPQENFGVFLNEMIELAYLIPNAAPEIINHYCVGVLWTIPVQLQYSFVVLLATVMIKDIRRPWKRMLFYTVTIAAGWYASSWSACHWLGLLLADADITYDWIKWTQARWYRLYPVLFLATGVTLATPLVLLFNASIYNWSFMAYENGIHPDPVTGRPIIDVSANVWAAYPPYYQPSLAVLTFSVGLQVIVELSTWVQAALSTKVIIFLHPHIMTIYLMHGFIFWSLGAYIVVALSNTGIPYWGTLLVNAVCCYSLIMILAVIMTPLIDFSTKGVTKNIWRWATEMPVPHRATTAPFDKALVLGRGDESKDEQPPA